MPSAKLLRKFVESLHAVHTSILQYDTILDLWGTGPDRPPIDTHHPAVRTHPVTGLKALNVNPGFVTGFAELKKKESDNLLQFLGYHIHSADDHYVRWKWEVGSVAVWDNGQAFHSNLLSFAGNANLLRRCSLHRVIPGTYKGTRRGVRTTVFGEKRNSYSIRPSAWERQSLTEWQHILILPVKVDGRDKMDWKGTSSKGAVKFQPD
jgi:sulfonate dioxygenase